jgi:hypothetical protein
MDEKCECGSGQYIEAQYDNYGIYCGKMCDVCFKRKYRQDDYFDASYAGESLEEDY